MQSRAARIGLLAALAAVAVILFVVLSGGDDGGDGGGSTTGTVTTAGGTVPRTEVIRIQNGAAVGGVKDLSYSQGDQVRLQVFPEPGVEEIHVHGYELETPISGTKPATISFTADITGGFEIEAHTAADEFQIAELKVNP